MRVARVVSPFVVVLVVVLIFAAVQPAFAQDSQAPASSSSDQAPAKGHPQTREGFWFNAGVGYGSLGCDQCAGRAGSLSGGLSLGGTVTPRLLLGVGTTGWTKQVAGDRLTVGTVDFRVRYYPVTKSGFFLTGGIGLGSVSVTGDSEVGTGLMIGVGWDIRVGKNTSLTAFYDGFAMRNSVVDANVGRSGSG